MLTAYVSPIKTAVSEAYCALIDSVKRACKGSVIPVSYTHLTLPTT